MAADHRMTGQQKSFRARTLHLQLFADFALKISLVLPEPARKQAGSSCLAPLLTDACIAPVAQTHAPAFPTTCEIREGVSLPKQAGRFFKALRTAEGESKSLVLARFYLVLKSSDGMCPAGIAESIPR